MTIERTYLYGGTSICNGVTKVRFANDLLRIKSLTAHNNDDIDFVKLPRPMTRVEVAQYLLDSKYKADEQNVVDACNHVINTRVLSTPKRQPKIVKQETTVLETVV